MQDEQIKILSAFSDADLRKELYRRKRQSDPAQNKPKVCFYCRHKISHTEAKKRAKKGLLPLKFHSFAHSPICLVSEDPYNNGCHRLVSNYFKCDKFEPKELLND